MVIINISSAKKKFDKSINMHIKPIVNKSVILEQDNKF